MLFEIEQLLELFVQGDAQKQGQFCGGVELASLDGADGLAGNAHHRRQFSLRELLLGAGGFQIVEQNQLVVHRITNPTRASHGQG